MWGARSKALTGPRRAMCAGGDYSEGDFPGKRQVGVCGERLGGRRTHEWKRFPVKSRMFDSESIFSQMKAALVVKCSGGCTLSAQAGCEGAGPLLVPRRPLAGTSRPEKTEGER